VDNCGTCWFNPQNRGQVGHLAAAERAPVPASCQIRGLEIGDPFWTYCANHPLKTGMQRIPLPVGPVVVDYERRLWRPSPDTEEVRVGLLGFLAALEEAPPPPQTRGGSFDYAVIWQLGEFREARALRGLERVCGFDPELRGPDHGSRRQRWAIRLAQEALAKILPASAVAVQRESAPGRRALAIACGVAEGGRYGDLPVLADALEEAGCTHAVTLAHLRQPGEHPPFCWVVELLMGRAELGPAVPDGSGPSHLPAPHR
jgi:hypothetical protein